MANFENTGFQLSSRVDQSVYLNITLKIYFKIAWRLS